MNEHWSSFGVKSDSRNINSRARYFAIRMAQSWWFGWVSSPGLIIFCHVWKYFSVAFASFVTAKLIWSIQCECNTLCDIINVPGQVITKQVCIVSFNRAAYACRELRQTQVCGKQSMYGECSTLYSEYGNWRKHVKYLVNLVVHSYDSNDAQFHRYPQTVIVQQPCSLGRMKKN